MARIHQLAVQATQTTNLSALAVILAEAVHIIYEEGGAPYDVPAIRLICYHIAFSGSGDILSHEYYRDVLEHCKLNTETTTQQGNPPHVEPRKTS